MQKLFYLSKVRKSTVLLFASIVLLCLMTISYRGNFTETAAFYAPPDGAYTMYKQLEVSQNALDTVPNTELEMNNLFFQNANAPEYPVALDPISTLTVYDPETSETFQMPIEEYTLSVLIAEMPQSFEMQALMAQAVACRTFAVRGAYTHSKHKNADVCTDYRCCQSFRDLQSAAFDITAAKQAVDATKGIIALYNNEPILAAYHASSVGQTRSSAEVWGGSLDYLVPVWAPEDIHAASQTRSIDKKSVLSALKQAGLEGEFSFSHDGSGFCIGASGKDCFIAARQLQNIFSLRSDTFSVSEDKGAYSFTSYGYGHGVGMSQHGANALAQEGFDFYEILKYYYTGISFGFIGA